ncbi:MAG: sigma 54-interacting transcriptional regulator [Thermodesulfobacteriota bacterium]|nr:sigma 54-interacting transcriptional regulator [Thermodesulfobacteriota bacterium]
MKPDNNAALERKIRELEALHEIGQLLVSTPSVRDALGPIFDVLHRRMGMGRGTITLLDPYTGELRIEAAHGMTDEEIQRGRYRMGEGITGRVVESGTPMAVPQVGKEPLFLDRTKSRRDVKKEDISFICVPIKAVTETYGALSVDRLFSDDVSLQEDVRLLTIMASFIAQSIQIHLIKEDEKNRLRDENISLRRKLQDRYGFCNIVGRSNKMTEVFEMIENVSGSEATVIIRGESGTGKELVANAIHYNSPRRDGPFVKVNCAALPDTLMESELFGHEKGAFTGAIQSRKGRFERADKGTIFLDEIGTLNLTAQATLLRVLQEREFERVGGSHSVRVDVRIIVATNKALEAAVAEGTFREDLYYRVNIFPIYLPPLRERRTDILLLAEFFLEKCGKQYGKEIERIGRSAVNMLMRHHWPGNVRELENCMERAVILCKGNVIEGFHLPPVLQPSEKNGAKATHSLDHILQVVERNLIVDALRENGGNMTTAAASLGTSERVMGLRVRKYQLNPKGFRRGRQH